MCPDTFAPSYSTIAAHQVGAVAQQAEDRKMRKYKHLDSCYFFTPVAIETSEVFGPKTTEFLKELGHRLRQVSGEETLSCHPNVAMQLLCWEQLRWTVKRKSF